MKASHPVVARDGDLMMKASKQHAVPKKHVSSVPDIVEEKRSQRNSDGTTSSVVCRYKKERFLGKVSFHPLPAPTWLIKYVCYGPVLQRLIYSPLCVLVVVRVPLVN